MPNLIDRDALYDKLENAKWESDFQNGHAPWNLGARVQTIANMPTVDAKPVVHGTWIEEPYLLGVTRRCNVCGENYGMPHGVFNFCPNCGAKNDGGDAE